MAISSAIGAEIGAANNIAASGPSISLMAGSCATMASTNRKKAVLNGKASAVAMHPPHRKAAAKSHGVSRSRRSRNQSTASGTAANKLDSTSAWRNTAMTSARMPPIRPRWTRVAKASTTSGVAPVTRHTPRRRSGEPINKRSLRAYETKAAIPSRKLVSIADSRGPPRRYTYHRLRRKDQCPLLAHSGQKAFIRPAQTLTLPQASRADFLHIAI